MTDITTQPTAEEVTQSYKAALDSVALLQAGKPEDMDDADWADCKQRNVDHLKLQLEKGADYYGSNDLAPLEQTIKK